MKRFILLLWFTLVSAPVTGADTGEGEYVFTDWAGPSLRVLYTQPPGLTPDRPVIIVMHGQSRAVERYHRDWSDLAVQHNFLLLVPEFSAADFPGSRAYNLGNVVDEKGKPGNRDLWSFSAIVPLFEDAKSRFDSTATAFSFYGHSAGSQFVHRFLYLFPEAPVERIVLANAGWYTLPRFSIQWPYGLGATPVDQPALKNFLELPVTVLLGEADTLTNQSNLRQTPEARAQGAHRLARGKTFFAEAEKAARELQMPFSWQLATVPGADHDDAKMAPAAVRYLLPR